MWKIWVFSCMVAFILGCACTIFILDKKNGLYEAFFKQYSPIVYGHKTSENILPKVKIVTEPSGLDFQNYIDIANELNRYRTEPFVFSQSNTNIHVQIGDRYAEYVLEIQDPPLKRWLLFGGIGTDLNIIGCVNYQVARYVYVGGGYYKTPFIMAGYQF